MRVELPRLLSVLSHELRGPLSVIQGYLRLMLKQRDSSHSDAPMIRAMLDATGRLAALGRQASDVSLWSAPASPASEVGIETLAQKTLALVPSGSATLRLDPAAGQQTVRTSDPDALAAALAAVLELASRDSGGTVELSAARTDDTSVTLRLTPARPSAADAPPGLPAGNRPLTLAFDRGGFGLSLVLASYVFDAHRADVRTGPDGTHFDIRLQKAGGSQ